MHNAVGRDVRQNTPHYGTRNGDTAKCRLEIIFFKMQKNGTARRRHGRGIIEPEFQKYVVKTIIAVSDATSESVIYYFIVYLKTILTAIN